MNTDSSLEPGILPGEQFERLRPRLEGRIALPSDDDWDEQRRAWQLLADQHPSAVVAAAGVQDVVETVTFARRFGLHVAPQSTGHGAGALPSLADTILLRLSALGGVDVDGSTGRARVGAGAVWGDVAAVAAEHGLAAVAGMSSTVGVVGLALGGGLGWLARSHGLAADSIVAIEGVDAQSRVIRADADHHADLFWAARGGAAPFIVTAIELQLHPIAELSAGGMLWAIDRTADVVHAWREWIADAPDSVTSLARVLRYPPLPELPESLRGRAFVAIEVAVQEAGDVVEDLLAPLRALEPDIDSVRTMSPAELAGVHGDPPQPAPAYGDAVVLTEISPASADAFVAAALAPASSPLVSIELRQLGGMLTPGRATGGAISTIDGAGLVYVVGIVPVPEALEPVRAATAEVISRLAAFASTRAVKTFSERPTGADALYGDAAEQVRRVAAAWDPQGIVRTAHPLR